MNSELFFKFIYKMSSEFERENAFEKNGFIFFKETKNVLGNADIYIDEKSYKAYKVFIDLLSEIVTITGYSPKITFASTNIGMSISLTREAIDKENPPIIKMLPSYETLFENAITQFHKEQGKDFNYIGLWITYQGQLPDYSFRLNEDRTLLIKMG